MTREEAERRIKEKAREIADILKAYNPDSNYFTLYMRIKKNWVNGNNEYWSGGEDENKPIDFYGQLYEEDKQMTKAEAVRQLKESLELCGPPASPEAIEFAISALDKEKEPAPSANDASPKQNLSKKNDNTEKAKCQEHITVPEELSEDLFKLMIKLVQDMITSCVRHGIRDTRLVSRAVYAAIMASLEILFEPEEDSDDRN